jgi:hypothetical protein
MKLIANQSVKSLRQNGFKVRVQHQRFCVGGGMLPEYQIRQEKFQFSPKGGKTTILVSRLSDGTNFTGEAVCSESDQFNRKMGVAISLGRLAEVAKQLEAQTITLNTNTLG